MTETTIFKDTTWKKYDIFTNGFRTLLLMIGLFQNSKNECLFKNGHSKKSIFDSFDRPMDRNSNRRILRQAVHTYVPTVSENRKSGPQLKDRLNRSIATPTFDAENVPHGRVPYVPYRSFCLQAGIQSHLSRARLVCWQNELCIFRLWRKPSITTTWILTRNQISSACFMVWYRNDQSFFVGAEWQRCIFVV